MKQQRMTKCSSDEFTAVRLCCPDYDSVSINNIICTGLIFAHLSNNTVNYEILFISLEKPFTEDRSNTVRAALFVYSILLWETKLFQM